MIKIFPILIVFGLVTVCFTSTFSQHSVTSESSEERMRKDVYILASDSLQGREAATYGEQMASAYISKSMQETGLIPKGDAANSYLSEFRMSYPVIFKNATLSVDHIDFKYKAEFGATDLSAPGKVTAPLLNTGSGDIASSRINNKFAISDIKGKIVVVDIACKYRKSEKRKILEDIIAKVKALVNQGAVGVVLHNSSKKPIEDLLFGSPFTDSLSVPVVYLSRLPYEKISKIKTATCTLSVEIDRTVSKPANVIGWIDNNSPKTVIVGAHYDHLGVKQGKVDEDQPPRIFNGADDNASGTAAMLELARWAVNQQSLKYNYMFVAFSAEEKGLFGSKAFCTRPWVNNDNIAYMLNLDMVGRLGCKGDTISILGVSSSPVWAQTIDNLEHPDFSILKINGAPAFSDHAPFLKNKIPIIYFTSGLHDVYHTPKDDSELINFKGMAEIVSYIQRFMISAESLPEIPFHRIHNLQQAKAYLKTF